MWNILIILKINKKKTVNAILFLKNRRLNRNFTEDHSKMAKKCMQGVQLP